MIFDRISYMALPGIKCVDFDALNVVKEHYPYMNVAHLTGGREKEFVIPRHLFHWLVYKFSDRPMAECGKLSGRNNHATVLNSIKAVINEQDCSKEYSIMCEYMTAKMRNLGYEDSYKSSTYLNK